MVKKNLTLVFSCFIVIFIVIQVTQSKQLFSSGTVVYGQNFSHNSFSNDSIIAKFSQLSIQQLMDTAKYYKDNDFYKISLICYNLIINFSIANSDLEARKRVVRAYENIATIYIQLSDYRSAYELLIKALVICEEINYTSYKPRIYNKIGGVYYFLKKYDLAKQYCLKALNICNNSSHKTLILNNLGDIEIRNENMDSAIYYLNESLQISKQQNDRNLDGILNTIALFWQKKQNYDSAFYYYRWSLQISKENNRTHLETENLSNIGYLFFEINKIDSALFYLVLSNTLAKKSDFQEITVKNYLTLSKISELKGDIKKAFEYHKEHTNLKDALFDIKNFSEISQLQRLYEVAKTDQQIKQLAMEKQIKERTIYYQKIIQYIILFILLSVCIVLLFILLQKKRLNKAYRLLVEKNLKIMNLQENPSEENKIKYRKSLLTNDLQNELMNRILILMEDTAITCDAEFTVSKLAELVNSNQTYVSQVINTILKKNFRSFLNEYRIMEAQRLFSCPNATKYTIESIAFRVGFKSRVGFHSAFKEIVGVTPAFYLKSIQEHLDSVGKN